MQMRKVNSGLMYYDEDLLIAIHMNIIFHARAIVWWKFYGMYKRRL